MPVNTLGSGQVIDLRGSDTGLEGLGQVLGMMLGKKLQSEEDKQRQELEENPELKELFARQGRTIVAEMEKMGSVGEAPSLAGLESGEGFTGGTPSTGKVDPQKAIRPTLPSGRRLTPGLMEELMQTYPESPEEAFNRLYTPEDRAKAQKTKDRLGSLQLEGAEFDADLRRDWEARYPKSERLDAMMEDVRYNRRTMEFKLDEMDASEEQRALVKENREFFESEVFPTLSDAEQKEYRTALAPGGGALTNMWSQQRAFDQQDRLANMRAILAQGTPEEAVMARFGNLTLVNKEITRVVDQLIEAVDSKQNKLIPGYINQLQRLGETLHTLDPLAVIPVADRVNGILRKGNIRDIEFRTASVIDTNAAQIESVAAQFSRSEMGAADMEQLQQAIAAVFPPELVNGAFNLAVARATELKSGEGSRAKMLQSAAARSLLEEQGGVLPEELERRYNLSLLDFNTALAGDDHDAIRKAFYTVSANKMSNFLTPGLSKLSPRGQVY